MIHFFRPKLSEKVLIEVLATNELKELTYQVFGRGKMIESQTIKANNAKTHTVEISPSLMMIPKANVVVYYISPLGDIVSDKIDIEFGNELINHVI